MSDRNYERTLYEVELDICYAARFHALHERLFRRIRWTATVVQLASVTALLAPYLSGTRHPVVSTIGAVVLVSITILDAATDFAGRVFEHRERRRAFEALRARTPKMSYADAESAYREIEAGDTTTQFDSLSKPAFNENLRSHGRESFQIPLTIMEKIFRFLA